MPKQQVLRAASPLPRGFALTIAPSTITWLLLLGSIVANAVWLGDLQSGVGTGPCFRTDALVPFVECKGFVGAGSAAFVLTLPWMLMLGPGLAVLHLPLAVVLWTLLLIYPLCYAGLAWYAGQIARLRYQMVMDCLSSQQHPAPGAEADRLILTGAGPSFLKEHGGRW